MRGRGGDKSEEIRKGERNKRKKQLESGSKLIGERWKESGKYPQILL